MDELFSTDKLDITLLHKPQGIILWSTCLYPSSTSTPSIISVTFGKLYGKTTVTITQLRINQGINVTQCFEKYAKWIFLTYLSHLNPDDILWIEHWEDRINYTPWGYLRCEVLTSVKLKWEKDRFALLDWGTPMLIPIHGKVPVTEQILEEYRWSFDARPGCIFKFGEMPDPIHHFSPPPLKKPGIISRIVHSILG